MHKLILFLIFITICSLLQAQNKQNNTSISSETWKILSDVKFRLRDDYYTPQFGDRVKALQGKSVEITGYIYPFEQTRWSKHFALSSLPLNACFFCGVGGPETVVEVEAHSPVKQSEDPIRIRGTLILNSQDPEKMIYIIRNAVVTE
ncbi:hypothetical protein QNI16_24445 [Cytophagaceae bacterium YF14B1]|uniref:DUF3299 domain-containing protein n=1 Tax=Xanthocytophaga flava TaxID=3048013 RepID=A0AAE3QUR6_9BACT|nr:hypothetical protein [Xanthocytophaga flavus]MDJ1483671.1 hypothetical protein [Xanthocytophaga flavus]